MARRVDSPARTGHAEPDLGFALHLQPRPGCPPAEWRRLERGLEDYAEAHGLQLDGTQLRHRVRAPERPLGADDQVALIDWLIDQPAVVALRIGPIGRLAEARADDEAEGVHVRVADIAVIGLTLLYRCGRITPALYLQILGGHPLH